MQTHDRVDVDQEPEKRRNGTLLGIAAAAAIVVGVLVLFRPAGNTLVAVQPTTPVDIATAFVEAYAAYDADKAASYLTDTALQEFRGDIEALRLETRWNEAEGFKVLLDNCMTQTSSPSGVRCAYDFHAIRSDEMGLGPFSGSWFDFTVLEGKIVSVSEHLEYMAEFSGQVWEPFARWVAGTHPEDVLVLYTNGSQTMQRVTEDSIAVWEQRSREYVAATREKAEAESIATAFVEAYGAFDADTAASYLAADADLSSFEWDGGDWRLSNALAEAQGFKLLLDSCEAGRVSVSGTIVSCSFDFHSLRSDEIGLGPFSGNTFDVRVLDGEIARASMRLNYLAEFSPQVWEPFALWVAENYPEDVEIMYTNSSQSLEALTEESVALWEQRTREYVDVVGP